MVNNAGSSLLAVRFCLGGAVDLLVVFVRYGEIVGEC